jgi:hypothetical protein
MMRGRTGWRDESRIGPNIHPTPPVKKAMTAHTGNRHASRYTNRRTRRAAGIWAMRW